MIKSFKKAQSGTSTKRGIKTFRIFRTLSEREPRAGHPLKEGLRLSDLFSFIFSHSQSGTSTKRGIKTYWNNAKVNDNGPRAGHPLKEGLRQCHCSKVLALGKTPRAGHPLKEGLRLLPVYK